MTERVVADEERLVHVRTSGCASREARIPGSVAALGLAVADLSGLDEDGVVETTDLAEHEVARGRVLGGLDELRHVAEATALVRVDESDVGLAQARDVARGQSLDGVLHGCSGEVVLRTGCSCGGLGADGAGLVPVVDARDTATVVAEDLRGGATEGVAALVVQVLGHVAAEQTGSRSHDVVERSVEQQFGNCDRVAMLGNGDLDLLGCERLGGHADTFSQRSRRRCHVDVTHEVDLKAGGNAQFGLLNCELLEAQDRHGLEQDLLGPNGLDGLGQVAVCARVGGGGSGEGAGSGDGRCHGCSFRERGLRGLGLLTEQSTTTA